MANAGSSCTAQGIGYSIAANCSYKRPVQRSSIEQEAYHMEEGRSLLASWESFYVITGSAAAVLIGLQFIVVTLGAQMQRGDTEAYRAFGTPTIVHFCAVLFIAAIMSAPWPSLTGPAYILGLGGVAALL